MRSVRAASAWAALRARRLAAARRRATALLAGVTVLFVAVTAVGVHGTFLSYVQAGAEAAMVAGVAHELRRRVEAHGLAVEDGAGEDVRVEAFEPGRDIDQQREARRVALGEAVFAEALDLLEAALGEVLLVVALDHAGDELVAEGADGAHPAEGRHGAAQPVGFRGREAAGDDGDLHRLLLEQRHAQRLAEYRLEFRGRIAHRLQALPPAQIGMHHVALDRAGPHDRHFDDEIVEIRRLQPRQHGHLRAAFHLEHAERIRPLQHAIDGRVLGRDDGKVGVRENRENAGTREQGAASAHPCHLERSPLRAESKDPGAGIPRLRRLRWGIQGQLPQSCRC